MVHHGARRGDERLARHRLHEQQKEEGRVAHRGAGDHADPRAFFADLAVQCAGTADFVDGVVFGPGDLVLSVARFVDDAPWLGDYTFENIYYRSLRERELDFLSVRDYLWSASHSEALPAPGLRAGAQDTPVFQCEHAAGGLVLRRS